MARQEASSWTEKEFWPFLSCNMSSLLKLPREENPTFCPIESLVEILKQVPVSQLMDVVLHSARIQKA